MADTPKRKDRSWILLVLALLLMLGGVGIFFYPTVSNYLAEQNQATVIQQYIDTTVNEEQDLSEEWELAFTYNANLSGNPVQFPFMPGTGYVLPENYMEVLNLNGDGVMGYISIPKIHVNLPIYHGCDDEVLQKGAGHIEQTFLPIGGEGTHSVISGHRALPHAEMFSRLDELEYGDIFTIHVLDQTLAYEVDQISIVLPADLEGIKAIEGEDLVTLVTCTPYAVNTHRLLVRGHRVEYVPETMTETTGGIHVVYHAPDGTARQVGIVLGIVLVILLFLIALTGRKTKRRRKRREKR